eukprot:Trichotokara_eunicae@DN5684_c0_g1_i1.p1
MQTSSYRRGKLHILRRRRRRKRNESGLATPKSFDDAVVSSVLEPAATLPFYLLNGQNMRSRAGVLVGLHINSLARCPQLDSDACRSPPERFIWPPSKIFVSPPSNLFISPPSIFFISPAHVLCVDT